MGVFEFLFEALVEFFVASADHDGLEVGDLVKRLGKFGGEVIGGGAGEVKDCEGFGFEVMFFIKRGEGFVFKKGWTEGKASYMKGGGRDFVCKEGGGHFR